MKHIQNDRFDANQFKADRSEYEAWSKALRDDGEREDFSDEQERDPLDVLLSFLSDGVPLCTLQARALALLMVLCPESLPGSTSEDLARSQGLSAAQLSHAIAILRQEMPFYGGGRGASRTSANRRMSIAEMRYYRRAMSLREKRDSLIRRLEEREMRAIELKVQHESELRLRAVRTQLSEVELKLIYRRAALEMQELDRELGIAPHPAPALEASAKQGAVVGLTASENGGRTPFKSLR